MLTEYITLFKAHERVLIICAVLFTGYCGYGKYLDSKAAHLETKAANVTQTVTADKQDTAQLSASASQADLALQKALEDLAVSTARLRASLSADQALLAKNRAADAELSLPALGSRIETLAPEAKGGVTATSNGLAVDTTASRGIANQLEAVPILTGDLRTETQVAQNNVDALTKCTSANTDLKAEVTGLTKETKDLAAKDVADVDVEKVKTKKAWRNGFKIGAIVGFISGLFVGHSL